MERDNDNDHSSGSCVDVIAAKVVRDRVVTHGDAVAVSVSASRISRRRVSARPEEVRRADGYIPVRDVIACILRATDEQRVAVRVHDISAAVILIAEGIPVVIFVIFVGHNVWTWCESE